MSEPHQKENGTHCSREQLEERLQQSTKDLESLNRELQAISYTIAHDLRAPLRAIGGFTSILLENHGPNLPAEALQLVDRVRSNAEQMGRLIEGLLDFHHLSRQPMIRRLVQPSDLVRKALAALEAEQNGRQIEITVGNLPACEGDPELLQRAFFDLLSNALKFTRARELARITIGSAKVGDLPPDAFGQGVGSAAIAYFVADNGVGFDMQYADQLFGIFQRLHSASDYEGTGIGLAVVQRIVHRHGGLVWASAAPHRGATFCFTLANTLANPPSPLAGKQAL